MVYVHNGSLYTGKEWHSIIFSKMDESADVWLIEISLTQRQVLHISPNVEQFKLSI